MIAEISLVDYWEKRLTEWIDDPDKRGDDYLAWQEFRSDIVGFAVCAWRRKGRSGEGIAQSISKLKRDMQARKLSIVGGGSEELSPKELSRRWHKYKGVLLKFLKSYVS